MSLAILGCGTARPVHSIEQREAARVAQGFCCGAEAATAPSREVLAECGNMSSPTVLFILERLRERHAPRPCLALGFGPGLAVEAALLV